MKNQWLKLTCAGLALLMLSLTALACPAPDNGKTKIPEISFQRVAPNNLDLPGEVVADIATAGEGALVVNENVRLWVPPGAVAIDTAVTIKLCTETPPSVTSTVANAPEVIIMSDLYDLGPDNTQFTKPVTVSIPYSEELIPAGADESQIGPVYFDGRNWVPFERQVDTVNNIVSFQTKSFPGLLWGLVLLPATKIGWAVLVGTTAVAVAAWKYAGPIIVSNIVRDPVAWGSAKKYITPQDPVVQKYAAMAKISLSGEVKALDIKDLAEDAAARKEFTSNGEGSILFVDGTMALPLHYQKSWNPFDWQKPADYFSNGMYGDCKNVANAMASIFRYYGFPAKCVDGFQGEVRHAWVEVNIDGQTYYVGAHGEIKPLEKAVKDNKLTRPKNTNGQGFMWDEKGQKPYKNNWWVGQLQVTIDETKSYPGGQVGVEVFGAPGLSLNLELKLEDPNGSQTQYHGITDKTSGIYRLTLPLKVGTLPGLYYIRASNPENNVDGSAVF
jgi:hypothetical protein